MASSSSLTPSYVPPNHVAVTEAKSHQDGEKKIYTAYGVTVSWSGQRSKVSRRFQDFRALHTVLQRKSSALARLVLLDNCMSAECERLLASAGDVKGSKDAERGVPPQTTGQASSAGALPSTSCGSPIASTTTGSSRKQLLEVHDNTEHV